MFSAYTFSRYPLNAAPHKNVQCFFMNQAILLLLNFRCVAHFY